MQSVERLSEKDKMLFRQPFLWLIEIEKFLPAVIFLSEKYGRYNALIFWISDGGGRLNILFG